MSASAPSTGGSGTGRDWSSPSWRTASAGSARSSTVRPAGPGAPPGLRVRAFLHALVDLVEEQRELLLLAEASSPGARYGSPPYAAQHTHLAALLEEAAPGLDAAYLADALLAPFTPSLISYQLCERRFDTARIKAGLDDLVGVVLSNTTA